MNLAGRAISRATGVTVVAVAVLSGCNGGGNSSGSVHVGGPFSGIFGTRRSPNAELTPQEGRKLLLDVQKDPKRLQKLTPPERRYLAKAGLVNKGELDER
ncbi:MAG: hypothetical protein ACK4WH_13290 [Phycisphaerales bacterium]